MKLNDWLKQASHTLEDASVPTARLDALVLLVDATGKDRGWLLAHPEVELTSEQVSKLASFVERRAKHEPLAYIRGKSEFYGREFIVTPATLQPRPETETMIKQLLDLVKGRRLKVEGKLIIVDVGTGSGCLAITSKLEWPEAEVYATEINSDALKVAKQNANKLNAEVKFYLGNLLEPLSSIVSGLSTIILANLPYVPDSHTINESAMQEPRVAIFGGKDGLDIYRKLFKQLKSGFYGTPVVLTESLPFQHEALAEIAGRYSYKQTTEDDFIQVFIRTD